MAPQMQEAGAETSGYGSDGGQWSGPYEHDEHPQGRLKKQLNSLAGKAKAEAAEAIQPMKEQARKVAEDQKNVLADRIGAYARAMDAAADQCGRESAAAGEVLSAAAGSIRSASNSLRERGVDDLTQAVQQLARNQPGALFAGAIVAGFALSRFLKSSAPEQSARLSR